MGVCCKKAAKTNPDTKSMVKEVDKREETVRFYQEIYDAEATLLRSMRNFLWMKAIGN